MLQSASARFLAVFFAGLAALGASVGVFNVLVDPLQYYRIPTWRKPTYFAGYQRYQYVGLARNYDYETVVIGSSLMENFLASHIDRSWGVRAMKLAISGSTPYEQRLILEQALATGRVHTVIWGLEHGGFFAPPTRVRDDQAPFPYNMYRRWSIANWEYPLSYDTVKLSIGVLRGNGATDLDRLDTWYDRFEFSRAAVLRGWNGDCRLFAAKYRDGETAMPEHALAEMRASTRANLIDVIRAHPDVTFYLVLLPVSTYAYMPARTGYLPGVIAFRRFVLDALIDEVNVRVFDFAAVRSITDDLDNYKDAIHFSLQVSDDMINAMHAGRHRIHREDIEPAIARLIEQANSFDLCRGAGTASSGR
jgi:hypothetical protein